MYKVLVLVHCYLPLAAHHKSHMRVKIIHSSRYARHEGPYKTIEKFKDDPNLMAQAQKAAIELKALSISAEMKPAFLNVNNTQSMKNTLWIW